MNTSESSPLNNTFPNHILKEIRNINIEPYLEKNVISKSYIIEKDKSSTNNENINLNQNKENIPSLKNHSFITIKNNKYKTKNKLPLTKIKLTNTSPEPPKKIIYTKTEIEPKSENTEKTYNFSNDLKKNVLPELELDSIKRKTITRGGQEVKNVQITHVICSKKPSNFHMTEKLSTNNFRTNPVKISKTYRENQIKNGKFSYSSSCNDNINNKVLNLKGKTTIYQHARGIGMTNDRRGNINPLFYNSEIKKLEPIARDKKKEKVEYIENFRSKTIKNEKNEKKEKNEKEIKNEIIEKNKENEKKIIGNNTSKKNKKNDNQYQIILFLIIFFIIIRLL